MVPRIAGRYHVEGELGRGGAGRVYAVVDERTDRRLALKRVPAQLAAEKPFLVQLLKTEYQTLVQLSHPRIVEVYDYGVDEGSPYYTMELLDGSDLESLAPLAFRPACALLRDIALSLVIMHARRLVHRDITPSNVRRTSDGRAKLIDFGAMTAMGQAETLVGTPAFLAPEALRVQPIDGRADLFALGALAYWLLSRRLPFPARSFGELEKVWEQRASCRGTRPSPTGRAESIAGGAISRARRRRPSRHVSRGSNPASTWSGATPRPRSSPRWWTWATPRARTSTRSGLADEPAAQPLDGRRGRDRRSAAGGGTVSASRTVLSRRLTKYRERAASRGLRSRKSRAISVGLRGTPLAMLPSP